jgi:hypothetical protein
VDAITVGNHQANNIYGSPASIYYDASNLLHATSECASFTTLLLINSYPNVVTASVMETLTGSQSPDAAQYYDAIDPSVSHSSANGISFVPMDSAAASPTGRTMSYLAVGDILASKYDLSPSTGHVMTVSEITVPTGSDRDVTLSGNKAIPGVAKVHRWRVRIFDSTSSPHGKTTDTTKDTRYQADASEPGGNDTGIGSGSLFLYEDAATGQLVGWTWSTQSGYTYQFTDTTAKDDLQKTTYRRMVIGRLTGL